MSLEAGDILNTEQ